jgi:hypothetical protein
MTSPSTVIRRLIGSLRAGCCGPMGISKLMIALRE